MKALYRRSKPVLFAIAAVHIAVVPGLFACGLNWDLPANHFDGVNAQGYVAYWEKVTDIDFGGGLRLPLVIGFRSNKENGKPSPYLGSGWIIPLLESSIIQTDENSFVMMQPNGWNNLFVRRDGNMLDGSAGWKAEIQGDDIYAWARCGWKMRFHDGHIASLFTPSGARLDYDYTGSVVTSVQVAGAAKLWIEQAPDGTETIVLGDRRIHIVQDQKPDVQEIAGKNVITQVSQSLKSIQPSGGSSKTFQFSVDDKVRPNLLISSTDNSERLITWDPGTKRIVSDNNWNYQISYPGGAGSKAAITRTNAANEMEYWFDDTANGRETSTAADGTELVTTWFVRGPAAGKMRTVTALFRGKTTSLRRYSYDEEGKLIRKTVMNGAIETAVRYVTNAGSGSAPAVGTEILDVEQSKAGVKRMLLKNGKEIVLGIN